MTGKRKFKAAALAMAALAMTGCSQSSADTTNPPPRPAREYVAMLDQIEIRPEQEREDYDRDYFKHWTQQPAAGNNCDAREAVLERDGNAVRVDGACEPSAGSWTSYYTGRTITQSSDVQVDHMVPLKEAWHSGADSWTAARREAFANDLKSPQLVISDRSSNAGKGDRDPGEWLPRQDKCDRCGYVAAWVEVKLKYHLSMDRKEKNTIGQVLATCPN